ncbi:MAG TPA: histidine phosphatase family protein [Pseudonocardiaceae bacterium]|nr:histidine phosphatase family protein [Pseudonocardiaceae bacterium]
MTRTLILLRHAKSAWPPDVPDAQRPLAGRGRRDAPAVGRWLCEHAGTIGEVVCSPAVRAAQTWDLAAAELAVAPRVRHDRRLYGAGTPELLAVTHELATEASTAVLVGHNPGLEDFLTLLTGERELLKTSSIAVITVPASWRAAGPRSCALAALATPRG